MNINILIDYLIISSVVSLCINLIARNIAKSKNILVDLPDRSRKFHKRPTPLTGGMSIFISLLISAKLYIDFNELNGFIPLFSSMLILGSFFIIIIFLIDDGKLNELHSIEHTAKNNKKPNKVAAIMSAINN